jgi:hypothetical protein
MIGHAGPILAGPVRASRFLVITLGLIYYLAYEHPQWVGQPGVGPVPIGVLPVRPDVWYTGMWLAFAVALAWLTRDVARARMGIGGDAALGADVDDRSLRRWAMVAVAVAYGVELATRLATSRALGLEERLQGDVLVALVGVAAVGLGATLLRPPPTRLLIAGLIVGGIAVRTVLIFRVPPDPTYADNLVTIGMSLPKLVAGQTPYVYYDFGTHVNPMPYLPWTVLGYVPPYLLGVDIRWTNVFLSTAIVGLIWWVARSLVLAPPVQRDLVLVASVHFILPISAGKDAFTEWQMFNVAVVLAFGAAILGRARLSAAAYGVAGASMPLAIFFAPSLAAYALRTRPPREVAILVAIVVAAAGLPTLAFLALDPAAMVATLVDPPREFAEKLARGEVSWPYLLLWHTLAGTWLPHVQPAIVFATIAAAARWVRDPVSLVAVAAMSYLTLVLFSPLVVPHMFPIVLALAIVLEAAGAAYPSDPAHPPATRRTCPELR